MTEDQRTRKKLKQAQTLEIKNEQMLGGYLFAADLAVKKAITIFHEKDNVRGMSDCIHVRLVLAQQSAASVKRLRGMGRRAS